MRSLKDLFFIFRAERKDRAPFGQQLFRDADVLAVVHVMIGVQEGAADEDRLRFRHAPYFPGRG